MVTDELTHKALTAFFQHGHTVTSWQTDPHGAMATAIEAIKPDIEARARAEHTRAVAQAVRDSVDGVYGSWASGRRSVADFIERHFGIVR